MTPKNSGMHGRSEAESKRAGEPSSPHHGALEKDPEYQEVDDLDLIYERTGTLSFPYLSRRVDSGVRATEAAGARPEATGAAESSAMSTLGRLVRDLRAASSGTPGVSMLATVDVVSGEVVRTAQEREQHAAVAEAEAEGPSPASAAPARAPRALPQRVAVGPVFPPARRGPVVAHRALGKTAHTFVAPPSSKASRHGGASPGREPRPLVPVPMGKRTTQPSLTRQRAHRLYPSFGQRVLAEVQWIPLGKRSVVFGVIAAVVVAGVFVASSTLLTRRVPRERAAPRPRVATVIDGRAPATAADHVQPRVSVVNSEDAPPEPMKTLERPALDARRIPDRSKGAKATARSNSRTPPPPTPHEPCDCFPGDPLCGCLD